MNTFSFYFKEAFTLWLRMTNIGCMLHSDLEFKRWHFTASWAKFPNISYVFHYPPKSQNFPARSFPICLFFFFHALLALTVTEWFMRLEKNKLTLLSRCHWWQAVRQFDQRAKTSLINKIWTYNCLAAYHTSHTHTARRQSFQLALHC